MANDTNSRPNTCQADLAKLPAPLLLLCKRPQWAVWRWTPMENGRLQKPPFMATQLQRHASTKDPSTWCDYDTALASVQAGNADGVSYILTEHDPFAAIDLDHCRNVGTHSIDMWAQNFLDTGRNSYSEVTPSGTGCRIWGLADGNPLHKKFSLRIDGKDVAVELFRRTNKALTITGCRLDTVRTLANIDRVIDWGIVWGERRKAAAAQATAPIEGSSFDSGGCAYSIDQIEQMVREGVPVHGNRSDAFHMIVGHYLGCGWDVEQILEHLQQFPNGIGSRYMREDRLHSEIARSVGKYTARTLPLFESNGGWVNGWDAKAQQPEISGEEEQPLPEASEPVQQEPAQEEPAQREPNPDVDGEVDCDLDGDLDEQSAEGTPQDPKLPPLYAHGDPDPRPLKNWLVKHLIPVCGHGLLSGQWGAGKTFVVFDLFAALATGQPFLGYAVKRRCGMLLIAAEGADEVRLRLGAVVRTKCGNMTRAPVRWYETAPMLLHKGSVETLIAMAGKPTTHCSRNSACPWASLSSTPSRRAPAMPAPETRTIPATGQAVMNVLKAVAQAIGCFVLGVDHFGKNLEAGTRGASSKESAGDLVLACLGKKELSGNVVNTRLAVRKNRGGRQGQEYPFTLRIVEEPRADEAGERVTTMVVDWQSAPVGGAPAQSDPWQQCRRQDQLTAVLRLKRVLMSILAEKGVELPIPPNGPVVRMVDQELVREQFYTHTPADGTLEQKGNFRRQKFLRTLDWAEQKQLIGIQDIDGMSYLWLTRPDPEAGEEERDTCPSL